MKRGFEAVRADLTAIAGKPLPDALKAIGTKLVMTVGGASGPLYGTLFLTLGKELPAEPDRAALAAAFAKAVDAVAGARQVAGRPEDHARRALSRSPQRSPPASRPAPSPTRADAGGGRDRADEGDPRPRLLPRRPLDRPHRSRRALQRADHSRRRATVLGAGK